MIREERSEERVKRLIDYDMNVYPRAISGVRELFGDLTTENRSSIKLLSPHIIPYTVKFYLTLIFEEAKELNLDVSSHLNKFQMLNGELCDCMKIYGNIYAEKILEKLKFDVKHWQNFVSNGLFVENESNSFINELLIRDEIEILSRILSEKYDISEVIRMIEDTDIEAKKQAKEQLDAYKKRFPHAFRVLYKYPKNFWWRHWDDLD